MLRIFGIFIGLFLSTMVFAQLDFIDKIYSGEDGVNGIRASEGITSSHDEKHVYVGSQRGLSVFDYNSSTNELEFKKTYYYQTDHNYRSRDIQCIILSNDDEYLYAVSRHNGTIIIYKRDSTTGLLRYIMDYNDDAYTYSFMSGLCNIRISDDDRFIYAGAYNSECISVMERDLETGELENIQVIRDHDPGGVPRPEVIKLSKDNRFVYVISIFDDCISIFERDDNTGLLRFVEKVIHLENGVTGLNSISGITITEDDQFLYSFAPKNISLFQRNTENGKLNFIHNYNIEDSDISGIKNIYSSAFSEDNNFLYTVSFADSCLSVFQRNTETGELTQIYDSIWVDYFHPGSDSKSQDAMLLIDDHILFTVYWESSIVSGLVNTENGLPHFEKRIVNEYDATIKGLRKANLVTVSADQEYVFIATERSFMSVFKRDHTTGKIGFHQEFKDFGYEVGDFFRIYSILTVEDYLYVSMSVGGTNCINIMKMNDQDSLSIVKTITIEDTGAPPNSGFGKICISEDKQHLYTGTLSNLYHFSLDVINKSIEYINFIDVGDIVGTNVGFDEIEIANNGEYLITSFTNMDRIALFKRDVYSGDVAELAVYLIQQIGDQRFYHRDHLAISPDGKNVLFTFNSPPSILNFKLDQENDTLLIDQIFYGEETSSYNTDELNQVFFDPTGNFLYAATLENGSMDLYLRDTSSGNLELVDKFSEDANGFQGIDMTRGMAFGGQGEDVYILSWSENSISTLKMGPFLGSDKHICEGDSLRLKLPYVYDQYLWSTGETSSSIEVDTSGVFWVEITDPYGIADRDSIEVFLHSADEISLGNDTTICEGKELKLIAGNFISYLWNDNSDLSYLNIVEPGIYSVSVENQYGCWSADTINIEYEVSPNLLEEQVGICDNDTIVLKPLANYNNPVWNNTTYSDSLTCYISGIYTLVVESDNACIYRDTIEVLEYPKPNLPDFISANVGTYISLYPDGGPFETVIWQDSIDALPWEFNPSLYTKDSLEIKALMKNEYGCSNTKTSIIYIDYSQSFVGDFIDKVFPNPTRGDLTIHFRQYFDRVDLSWYDTHGRFIQSKTYKDLSKIYVDISDYRPGVYYAKIQIGDQVEIVQVVLVR